MLAYFKNYKTISYIVAFAVPLAIIGIIFLVTGVNPMTGVAGGAIYLVLMLALLFGMSRYLGQKADAEAERMMALYNDNCDPQAFREEAKAPSRAIYEECYAGATSELGSWFLAPYALACADAGETDDAELMEKTMINGMSDELTAYERAAILINIEPLTFRLHGAEAALSLANRAEALLAEAETPPTDPKARYLTSESSLLQAMLEGDAQTLLTRFEAVVSNESIPMRMRVLEADAQASIYDALSQLDAERKALQFVIDNGNNLPVVTPAKVKLAKLQ